MAALTACLTLPSGLRAQAAPDQPPPPPPPLGDRFDDLLERVPPEKREKFHKNMERWKNMPEERRRELREEAGRHFYRMKEDFERAASELNLDSLSPERREALRRRYFEERRKLEIKLRKMMDAKRREGVLEIISRLQEEFDLPQTGTAAPQQKVKESQESKDAAADGE